MKTWILLANKGRAVIFNQDPEKYQMIQKFTNESALKKESNTFTDRSGTAQTSFTSDQTSVTESHYLEEKNHQFANTIVSFLDKAKMSKEFEDLIIVSEKSFIGDLRKKISTTLDKSINREVNKNFYSEKPHDVKEFMTKL